MANYYLNNDGSITSQKKKKKGNEYVLNDDGTISQINAPVVQQQPQPQQQNNGGFLKGGSSNFLEGLWNSYWDLTFSGIKGAAQTLEGVADTAQYLQADYSNFLASQINNKLSQLTMGNVKNNVVSDLFNTYADALKENAKYNSTASLLGENANDQENILRSQIRNDIKNKSYMGEMSNSIYEGGGNIAAMAALSAVGGAAMGAAGVGVTQTGALTTGGKLALSGGSSYMSAYGNARSEAYRNGANDDEANKAGVINGLAEAISEQFFDSMPGIKSAGFADKIGIKDFLTNKLKGAFGTNAGRVFLKLVGGLEEGAEEMISNAFVAVGNDLMHMLDQSYTYGMENQSGNPLEDGWNALFSEDSIKSFTSAGLTSVLLGVGGNVMTTAQTNQVINAFAKDNNISFKEAKAVLEGQTLETQKGLVREESNKGNIEVSNEVDLEDAARGRIINFMQQNQGKNVQNYIEDLVKEEEKRNNVTYTDEQRTKIANQIRNELIDRTNNPNKYTQFTLEKEPTNESEKEVYNEYRKYANNTKQSHDLYNFYKALKSKNEKLPIGFINNEELVKQGLLEKQGDKYGRTIDGKFVEETINGFNTGDKVLINVDGKNALEATTWHEIAHSIKDSNKEGYNELKQLIKDVYGEEDFDKNYRAKYESMYGNIEDLEDEYVNDKLGEMLNNEDFVNRVSGNQGLFKQIINSIKNTIKYMTSGSEQKKLMKLQKKLEDKYMELYKEAAFKNEDSDLPFIVDEEPRFSLSQSEELNNYIENNNYTFKDNGNLEVSNLTDKQINELVKIYHTTGYDDVDANYLKEMLKKDKPILMREVADRFIEKELGHKPQIDTTKVFEDSEGNSLTQEQVNFFKDSGVRDIRGRLIPVYHRTNADFTIFDSKAGKQHGNKYGKGFYFSIVPENYGNNTMKVYLNAKDGEYKYIPKAGYYIVQEPNMIKNVDNTNPTSNPDIRYSLSVEQANTGTDNTGRELSEGQKEYFKNSKITDDNGNLIKVYHTMTDTGVQFNEFNPVGTLGYRYGDQVVNFFTDDKDMSSSYADSYETPADTSKLNNIEQAREWIKSQNSLFDSYDIKDYGDKGYSVTSNDSAIIPLHFNNETDLLKNIKQKFYEYNIQFGSDKGRAKYQYQGYVNITNPYIIDGEGRYWNNIESKEDSEYTKKMMGITQENRQKLIDLANESIKSYNDTYFNWQRSDDAVKYVATDKNYVTQEQKALNRMIKEIEFINIKEILEGKGSWGKKIEFMNYLKDNNLITNEEFLQYDKTDIIPQEILDRINNKLNEPIKYEDRYLARELEALNLPLETKESTIYDLWRNREEAYKAFDENGRTEVSQFLKNLSNSNEFSNYNISHLFEAAKNDFTDDFLRVRFNDWLSTNDIVKRVIESNNNGETNYDGVIMRNVIDYGGKSLEEVAPHDLYVTFNSNQFKAADNTSPTLDQDIRYSLSTQDSEGRELSPQQQEYFANSKIRDNENRLIPLYHGSNSEFTIFDLNKSGESSKEAKIGFWFTPSKKGAENFANEAWYGDKKPTTYEVYLNIKNPKIYETYEVDQQQRDDMLQNRRNLEQEIRDSSHKYAWTETGDYKVTSLYNDLVEMNRKEMTGIQDTQYNEEFYRKLAEERNISNEKFNEMNQDAKSQVELEAQNRKARDDYYTYVYSDAYEQFRTELYLSAGMSAEDANVGGMGMMIKNEDEAVANFVEGLKQQGYDGVIIKNTHYDNESLGEGKNNDQYVAFYSNQIKNIDNLNPTENEDIRYQLTTPGDEQRTTGTYGEDIRLRNIGEYNLPTQEVNTEAQNLPITEQTEPEDRLAEQRRKLADKRIKTMIEKQTYKSVKQATKIAKDYLGFDSKETQQFREGIEDLARKRKDNLIKAENYQQVKDLVGQFANRDMTFVSEELKEAQKDVRHTQLIVSDDLKNQITDWTDFRKRSGLNIKKGQKSNVDVVYQELCEMYPGMFDESITNYADQLQAMSEFVHKDNKFVEHYTLDDNTINRITNSVWEKLSQNALTKQDFKEIEDTINKQVERRTREVVQNALLEEMGITLDDIDVGKDITSLAYQRTDPKRVNEKVFGYDTGQKINDATTNFVGHQEADRIRFVNQEKQDIKDLGIKARSKESAAVQKYGEKQYVNKFGELVDYTDKDLMNEFPKYEDQQRIKNAARVSRQKYDEYIDKANDVLVDMGYDPIPKRQDYFKHFTELEDKFSQWGLPFSRENLNAEELPTDINGLTDQFKPGKNFFASAMERKGLKTTYDAITGIDKYIDGASNLMYHTESIQRYRTLSKFIRNTYGQTHGLEDIESLTPEQAAQRVEDVYNNKLSRYAAWLDEQANALAGKKGGIDRAAERLMGRKVYTLLSDIKKQVGSNMTGFNVRSAMTNFASAIQGASKTQKLGLLEGTAFALKNYIHEDSDFINKSDFLVRRFGTDQLSKKAWQKISEAGQVFMNATDRFTSLQIWGGKYYEGLNRGLTQEAAIKQADDFAARIMGDRSKGQTAEIFNSKTLGLLTQFQLEVNNQWSSMVHDNKMEMQKNPGVKSALRVVSQLGQLYAASYFFNSFMKALTGSDVMFDPIKILMDIFAPPDDDEEVNYEERATKALGELINQIPMASIFTGGRIPISEAFTGVSTLGKKLTGQKGDFGTEITWDDVKDDLIASAFYYLMPTGFGQLKKTAQGLGMYGQVLPEPIEQALDIYHNENINLPGNYTKTGRFKYEAVDTTKGKVQAALFGRNANANAQEYREKGYLPLTEKAAIEARDANLPISEYREYKDNLKKVADEAKANDESQSEAKADFIYNLPYDSDQKNVLINGALNRKNPVDIDEYGKYGTLEELDYANKNPEKYNVIRQISSYEKYQEYQDQIQNLKKLYKNQTARKRAVQEYINTLPLNRYQKMMLENTAGGYSIKSYKSEMKNYINTLSLSAKEKESIDKELFS